jgi:phosphoglycolate phosphatase-like HAD superfamily hydrolase
MRARSGAIVDIDGTLVDTTYQHTIAWARAFAEHGVSVPAWRVHRHIGMGGDQLVPAIAGDDVEQRLGECIRESEGMRYRELIGEVGVLPGGRELLQELRTLGHPTVLASSAKPDEVDHYLDLLDARELVDAWTSAGDVDQTKPHADVITEAADTIRTTTRFVVIGDSVWDAVAAGRAGYPAIGVLSGGFGAEELRDAGCQAVFADAAALAGSLPEAASAAAGAGSIAAADG